MNPKRIPPASDAELEALLARAYRDTTPEFEARWVAMKRELRRQPAVPRSRWLGWLGALLVAGAALVLLVSNPHSGRHAPEASPALAELFAMDAVLSRGTALLDRETRDEFLNLPVRIARPKVTPP